MDYLGWMGEHPFLTVVLAYFASQFSRIFWFSRTSTNVNVKAKFPPTEEKEK
jgi:hypothetical protein